MTRLTNDGVVCYHPSMTSKILFVAPDDMRAALERESKSRGTPMSQLIRIAVADWLRRQGELDIEPLVSWGGYRGDGKKK